MGQSFVATSFLFPWFAFGENDTYLVFSRFIGAVGFFLVLSILGSLILIFSNSTKEILKYRLGVRVSDAAVMIFF